MATPAEVVAEAFAQAQTYANDAQTKLTTFTNLLNSAIQTAPLVDVSFTPIASPGSDPAPTGLPTYTAPADYSDGILTSLATLLSTRMNGGSGLNAAVEAGIWNRARDRETALAQAAIDTVTVQSEALAYELPPGVLNESIRRETRAYYDKASSLSRDIAIKQAELEQTNMRDAIEKANQYEETLSMIVTRRTQVAVEVFRAQILGFQAKVQAFVAQVDQDVKHWEVQIKQLEAQRTYVLEAQKINTEVVRANLATILEAAKTGSQVYAQLVAAAYSLIHASAAVSASAQDSVSYSYSNDTTSTVPPVTSV